MAIRIVTPDGTALPPIQLVDDEVAHIHNFDDPTPDAADLEAPEDCTPGEFLDDVDFNWLYQLVVPRQGTLTEKMSGGPLPRPQATCDGKDLAPARDTLAFLTPRTSSCFGGSWGE